MDGEHQAKPSSPSIEARLKLQPLSTCVDLCLLFPSMRKRETTKRRARLGDHMRGNVIGGLGFSEQIRKNKDYYAVLGVEKTCSVEEIRKAYRKLSLKVHPDKNKAPGSEEAFKTVSKAFRCLSDGESRRQYDQTGLVDEFEYNQQHNNVRRRRRRTEQDIFEDEFDPNEIFRAFFGQGEMFRASHVYRARGMGGQQPREEFHGGGLNFMLLLQILPFLLIILLAYLPFSEPEYSLHKNYSYQVPKTTEKYGVEFYVKSTAFDNNYPIGSSARSDIEDSVIKDYKSILLRYCQVELQRRHWNKNHPTPHCNKLHNLGLAFISDNVFQVKSPTLYV
ncbi:hypothetical protein F8388_013081 [Cannabis sativa]|uniref:J domain-containing protein n=1 Tax=Cannabis sativa TaxID=3483 RepID=A0A7J6EBI2_CANSA|nr:hypothetical protein F8388_013081 [Cannabis sativa]